MPRVLLLPRAARLPLVVLLALVLLGGCGPRLRVIEHDPEAAAEVAERFADLALVEADAAQAYDMITEAGRAELTLSSFTEQMEGVQAVLSAENLRPEGVRAEFWGNLPGEEAVEVYLVASNSSGEFYCRVRMEGTAGSGYRPHALYFSLEPYPEPQGGRFE